MDSALIQTIISAATGAIIALITTFGAIPLTQLLNKKQSLEQNYDDKLEELQNLYIEVKMHIEEEIRGWWIAMEYNGELIPSNYIYPIDKIIMLTERYEPSLSKDIEQVLKTIQILRGNDNPEDWMPDEAYYHQYINKIDFSKTKENLAIKFKEINQKYYQKRNSKRFTVRSNNQNQNQLPHVFENTVHKTISTDEW